jgi:hypothetical protein
MESGEIPWGMPYKGKRRANLKKPIQIKDLNAFSLVTKGNGVRN